MKCPDCKDGKYYPFVGPAEECKTCHGKMTLSKDDFFIPAVVPPNIGRNVRMASPYAAETRINLRQNDPHRGSWCWWEDHTKSQLIGQQFIATILKIRKLAVDWRNGYTKRRAVESEDPATYNSICDEEQALVASMGHKSPVMGFSIGPDILLEVHGHIFANPFWWHVHGNSTKKAFAKICDGSVLVGRNWSFRSLLITTPKYNYYVPHIEEVT